MTEAERELLLLVAAVVAGGGKASDAQRAMLRHMRDAVWRESRASADEVLR